MKVFKNDILEVAVAQRSHVDKPYFVLVETDGSIQDGFVTSIPGVGNRIWRGQNYPEYDYHKNRCKKIGTYETHGYLLYNQELIMNGKVIYSSKPPLLLSSSK